jgi:hypothetical protein
MLRAPRSMPNSSGGTPSTRAWASLRVLTMVTSWVIGETVGDGAAGERTVMFIGENSIVLQVIQQESEQSAGGVSLRRRP